MPGVMDRIVHFPIGDLPASVLESTTVGELLTGDNTSAAGYPELTLGDLAALVGLRYLARA